MPDFQFPGLFSQYPNINLHAAPNAEEDDEEEDEDENLGDDYVILIIYYLGLNIILILIYIYLQFSISFKCYFIWNLFKRIKWKVQIQKGKKLKWKEKT